MKIIAMTSSNQSKQELTIGTLCMSRSLCEKLGLKLQIGDFAYKSYKNVKARYSLDGDQKQWLGVSIFAVVVKKSKVEPEVKNISLKYKPIHLPNLMIHCEMSFLDFIRNCRTWASLLNIGNGFEELINTLEHKFAIPSIVFKKYQTVFIDMFCNPYMTQLKYPSTGDDTKCTPSRLFEFTWTLYVAVRTRFEDFSDDLVNSFNLLIACLDYIYANCLHSNLRDMMNRSFAALPSNLFDLEYIPQPLNVSVIKAICELHCGNPADAKTISERDWKPRIAEFFRSNILCGDYSKLMGVLNNEVFAINYKNVDNFYDAYVQTKGEFDERQFLIDCAQETVNYWCGVTHKGDLQLSFANNALVFGNGKWCLFPQLSPLRTMNMTDKLLFKLRIIIGERPAGPSVALSTLIGTAEGNISAIRRRVDNFINSVLRHLNTPLIIDELRTSRVAKRLFYAKVLYYKLFEDIMFAESKITQKTLSNLLEQDIFHRVLFACCFETVIYCHTLKPAFLWVFDALQVHGFHFYKIIELIIRTEKRFPAMVVRHLVRIEEYILDHLSWNSSSPLWEIIRVENVKIPSCASVDIRVKEEESISKPTLSDACSTICGGLKITSLTKFFNERFVSVINQDNDIEKEAIVPVKISNRRDCDRTLVVFFRKVYRLAHKRLMNVCSRLNIADETILRTIWTCLEYEIMHHSELLRDRHLDQPLLCSIFAICKILDRPLRFHDITKAYLMEPHSSANMYKRVSLRSVKLEDRSGPGEPVIGDIIQFYNDLFVDSARPFVNKLIYEKIMNRTRKTESKVFQEVKSIELSSFPAKVPAPRPTLYRVSDKLRVYVGALDPSYTFESNSDSTTTLTYEFGKFCSTDIHRINEALNRRSLKRSLDNIDLNNNKEDDSLVPAKKRISDSTTAKESTLTDDDAVYQASATSKQE